MNNKTGNVIEINFAKPKLETMNEKIVNTIVKVLYEIFGNNFVKNVALAEINPTAVVTQARMITSDKKIFPALPYNTFADAAITLPPLSKYPVTVGLVTPIQDKEI